MHIYAPWDQKTHIQKFSLSFEFETKKKQKQ
jgi:hypothetical protein